MHRSSSSSKSGMGIENGSGLFWKADPAKKDLGGDVSAGVLVPLPEDEAGVLLAFGAFLDDFVVDEGPAGGLHLLGVAVDESLAARGVLVGEDFRDFLEEEVDDVCDFVGTLVATVLGTGLDTSGSREVVSREDCGCGACGMERMFFNV